MGCVLEAMFAGDAVTVADAIRDATANAYAGVVLNAGSAAQDQAIRSAAAASDLPLVWLDFRAAEAPRLPHLDDPSVAVVKGRGLDGYRTAAQHVLAARAWPYTTHPYGPGRDRVGDLRLPANCGTRSPVVVLLHGGSWGERLERDRTERIAIDLARRGIATWNLEYRRIFGPSGGGWPRSCEDVAAGIDHLAQLAESHPLDLERVAYVGHSAGGHLALWAAYRGGRSEVPRIKPAIVVSMAGIVDLGEASRRGFGETGNVTSIFMGGDPDQIPSAYAAASPAAALPLGVRQVLVHGRRDQWADLLDMARTYADRARRLGDDVEFIELDEAGHLDFLDPASDAWRETRRRIEDALLVPVHAPTAARR
jgi:acetyl esterase/lipase